MTSQLWAPWRMTYLKGEEQKPGCFLCEHAKDESAFRENLVVVVQPHAYVLLNRYPFTSSHVLVAPRRHVADLADLEAEEYDALMRLVRDATVRLRRAVNCPAMNMGFNLGKAAGAGVPGHLHGHLVPRWEGDTNFLPVLADTRVMPEYLDESWRRLHGTFADLPGVRAPAPEPSP